MSAPDTGGLKSLAEAALARLATGDGLGALQLFTQILQQDPGLAEAFFGAGLALEMMANDEGAAASFRHAVELAPGLADAHGALAALAAKQHRGEQVRPSAERALALCPGQPAASIALAQLELHASRPEKAVAQLQPVIDGRLAAPLQKAQALRLSGEAVDRQGRPGEAFARYAASARIFRDLYVGECAGPEPMAGLDLCQSLARQYAAADGALWTPAAGAHRPPAAGHVFLLGFPRSGTTLLEQALAGHGDIVALEEHPTLAPVIDAYLDPPVGVGALAQMDAADADRWREVYWSRVRQLGVEPQGKVFVDKQPFYSLWLPLIGKLFPDAKIIVARRDPRDVVFSCFRNPFKMTPVTYELMDLERGAALYVAATQIIDLFMARAGNPVFVYRHEDLVQDFDGTLRRLCAFLGLEWSDAMTDFAVTAARRNIRTPSADQVRRGLNRDGLGVWKRHAASLAPVLPLLEPLAQRFGYAV